MKSFLRALLRSFPSFAIAAAFFGVFDFAADAQQPDRYREVRRKMVAEYIEAEGVKDKRVLDAMRSVPRHEFIEGKLRQQAYDDTALAIGESQTISPPFVVAYMTESIDPQPTDRVLEIGTGSGYQAAVLSLLVKDVYSIEIVEPLGKAAAARLKRLKYNNVTVKVGDGYKGWSEHAPFDKIIVTCSPESVPIPLAEQLKEGGKMIIPLGERYQQVFHLIEKRDGKLVPTKLIPTLFVPMTGVSEEQRKVKPDPLNPQIVNGGFEDDEDHDDRPDHWHYQRQVKLQHEATPDGKSCLCLENTTSGRSAQLLQGMGLDGRKVRKLKMSASVKYEKVTAGNQAYETPAISIHFYDATRRHIGDGILGPWTGSADWQTKSKTVEVPPKAREAILRIGMNGATGKICFDEVKINAEH